MADVGEALGWAKAVSLPIRVQWYRGGQWFGAFQQQRHTAVSAFEAGIELEPRQGDVGNRLFQAESTSASRSGDGYLRWRPTPR